MCNIQIFSHLYSRKHWIFFVRQFLITQYLNNFEFGFGVWFQNDFICLFLCSNFWNISSRMYFSITFCNYLYNFMINLLKLRINSMLTIIFCLNVNQYLLDFMEQLATIVVVFFFCLNIYFYSKRFYTSIYYFSFYSLVYFYMVFR